MKNLDIKIENCYGIGQLEHSINFEDDKKIALIYASNGTMKTSLANTLKCLSNKAKATDRIYTERASNYQFTFEGESLSGNSVFVIDGDINSYDATDKFSSFIASKELKDSFDKIYTELENAKVEFIKKLKEISKSTDCEEEILNTFSQVGEKSFFEIVEEISSSLIDSFTKYDFKYNDVFDKKESIKKFIDKHKKIIEIYFNQYQELISTSSIFKKSNNTFGTYQATKIIDSVEDNSFFNAGHKFVLENSAEITSKEQFVEIVSDEVKRIVNDSKLKDTFDKVDEAIGKNIELRNFKAVIENNNLLLAELVDYDKFKENVWISYLSEIKDEVIVFVSLYKSRKEELNLILDKAKEEVEVWKEIVRIFNSRFYVPFKIHIKNHEDIILKKDKASLEFDYCDNDQNNSVPKDKDSLLEVLSKGEKRAFNILQIIFEIEARKNNGELNFIVFDDISDSFDYKNKFAIVEYIEDISKLDNFYILILTHNFDFYRTIFSRLDIKRSSVYMASRNEKREINLHKGQYRNNVFDYFIEKSKEPRYFISLIPFVRNLIEYIEGIESQNYLTLTSCLHIKDKSLNIKTSEITTIFQNNFYKLKENKDVLSVEDSIVGIIYAEAENISKEENIDEVALQNKIVLAIAIRLKSEEFMIKHLTGICELNFSSHQTKLLYEEYKKIGTDENLKILRRVNLMTPENIHINAFMYEPLIDMSVRHLIDLYKEVNSLA